MTELVRGIDVYQGQGQLDWQAIAADGVQFVIVKATEGLSYHDPLFASDIAGARAAGLLVGAYHVLHAGGAAAGEDQARHFAETAEPLGVDLPPFCDWELGAPDVVAAAAFARETERLWCRPCAVYGSPTYLDSAHLGIEWAMRALWSAQYPWDYKGGHQLAIPLDKVAAYAPKIMIPKPWSSAAIWQLTGEGRQSGARTDVDQNVWLGTIDHLRLWVRQTGGPSTDPAEVGGQGASVEGENVAP